MKLILKYLLISLCFLFAQEKVFYLKYEENKNTIYKNQIFRVNLSLLSFDDNILYIESNMSNYRGIKIFDGSVQWQDLGENKFSSFLYFKALSTNIKLPDIHLTLVGYKDKYHQSVKGGSIQTKSLNWLGNSSYLLSSSLKVVDDETNIYDEKNNMLTLKFKGKNTNIEDLHIKGNEIIEQNITEINYAHPDMTATYYAIIPNYINEFKFNYLDINSGTFMTKTIKVTLDKKTSFLIQDINPDIKTYDKYKLILLMLFIALSLFMAYILKKISYLVFTLILILVLVKVFLIQTKTTIGEGSRFRVLPIDNSTIFYITKKNRKVVVLNKVDNYIKIQFQNKVGWVDEKNIIKN